MLRLEVIATTGRNANALAGPLERSIMLLEAITAVYTYTFTSSPLSFATLPKADERSIFSIAIVDDSRRLDKTDSLLLSRVVQSWMNMIH
jgi:hypothetical protein